MKATNTKQLEKNMTRNTERNYQERKKKSFPNYI